MSFKGLLSVLLSSCMIFNPAAFAGINSKSFRVPLENKYGIEIAEKTFGHVKNVHEFIKTQGKTLNSRDKAFLLKAAQGQKWPTIKREGDYLKIGKDVKLKFLGLYSKKVEINGIEFKLDFSAPLEIQAEVIARKLSANNKNAFYSLLIPEAHAFFPLLGLIAGVAVRVVATAITTVARVAGPSLVSGMGGAIVTSIVVFEKDPFGLIVCKVTGMSKVCETEDGTEVSPDVVDSPGTEYNLQVEIDKCPDTADGTFKMRMRVPEQKMSTSYTVATEQLDGATRITSISEVHRPDGEGALPPVEYSFDPEGLHNVKWVGSVVTADGSTHQVHKALDRRFSEEGSADNTAENREKWESFKQKSSFVRQALSLYCNVDNKRTVSEPGQTQPQTEVLAPASTPATQ